MSDTRGDLPTTAASGETGMAGGDGYSQNPVACDYGVHPHASKKVQLSFIFVIKGNTGVSHDRSVCCLFCVCFSGKISNEKQLRGGRADFGLKLQRSIVHHDGKDMTAGAGS